MLSKAALSLNCSDADFVADSADRIRECSLVASVRIAADDFVAIASQVPAPRFQILLPLHSK